MDELERHEAEERLALLVDEVDGVPRD